MSNINFPANPIDGQSYPAPNGVTYIYNSATNQWVTGTRKAILGATGATGPQGTGIELKGTVATVGDLSGISSPEIGDTWIVEETGDGYSWDGGAWVNIGQLVGPDGASGATGPEGPQGATGAQGIQGATGPQGPQGATGVKGDPGNDSTVQGPQGTTGATGPEGPQGATGVKGDPGNDSTVQGPQGTTGATGPEGPQGATGATGSVPPDITVDSITPLNGFIRYGTNAGDAFNVTTNVALGNGAGQLSGNGAANNVYVGELAGEQTDGASNNTYIGSGAGRYSLTFSDNAFLGRDAGTGIRGNQNTALGAFAAGSLTVKTGINNVFLGYGAGFNYTTTEDNTLLGALAGLNLTSGDQNTIVGQSALPIITSSSVNSVLGFNALPNVTSGIANVAMGYNSGLGLVNGGGCIFIGSNAGGTANNGVDKYGNNNIIIGPAHDAYRPKTNDFMSIGISTYSFIRGVVSPVGAGGTLVPITSIDSLEAGSISSPVAVFTDSSAFNNRAAIERLLARDVVNTDEFYVNAQSTNVIVRDETAFSFDFTGVSLDPVGNFPAFSFIGKAKIKFTVVVKSTTDSYPTIDSRTFYWDGSQIFSPTMPSPETPATDSEQLAPSGLRVGYLRDNGARTISPRFVNINDVPTDGTAKLTVEEYYD